MTTAGKFTCEACGKAYTWKPELAGKRAKCKCGQAIKIPATDPGLAGGDGHNGADDFVAAAPPAAARAARKPSSSRPQAGIAAAVPGPVAPTCPSCGAVVDPTAVICVNCGHNRKTGRKLETTMATIEARPPVVDDDDGIVARPARDAAEHVDDGAGQVRAPAPAMNATARRLHERELAAKTERRKVIIAAIVLGVVVVLALIFYLRR